MIDFSSQNGINALALFQSGQALAKQQQAKKALGSLALNPNDNSAFARLAQYDPEKAYQIGGQRQKMQREQQAGQLVQQAVGGNQQANSALAGLDVDTWAKIQPQMRAQIEQQNKTVGQLALWADTPEKWSQALQQAQAQGLDVSQYQDFNSRNTVLAQAGELDNWIKSQQPQWVTPGEAGAFNARDPQSVQNWQRSQGMATGQGAPPPPPGFVIEGGPTPTASGRF